MSQTSSMRARRYLWAGVSVVLASVLIWWLRLEEPPIAPIETGPTTTATAAESPVASTPVVASEVSAPVPTTIVKVDAPSLSVLTATSSAASTAVAAASQSNANNRETTPVEDNAPESVKPIGEVEGTRRMYVAHAPLRVPEVANPDSEANRMILQSMVQKALARAEPETRPEN